MNAPIPQEALAVPRLPVSQIVASPTNPRKHFNDAYLAEMAETIKSHGVIQPITVRPVSVDALLLYNKRNPNRTDASDLPLYEIVVGECRWRSSKLAGKEDIPAFWRDLTDKEVLEIQVIENLQRQDVHPLEEADGYRRLMDQHGYKIELLAEKVGKTKAYIYARLKLLAMCDQAQKAFFAGELNPSTALLIARIPDEKLQIQATKEITKGEYGHDGPMSVRQAEQHIHRRYMLKLAEAPFSRTAEDLVPSAGTCQACPKRTGNQSDLFADVKSVDVCTDPGCYEAKRDAHVKQQQALAKEAGRKVITGDAAKKIMPNTWSDLKGGYVDLNKTVYVDGKSQSVKQLLGKDAPESELLVNPHKKGELKEVISKATLKEKLEAKGTKAATAALEQLAPARGKTDAEKEAARKAKADGIFRQRLFDRIRGSLSVAVEQSEAPFLKDAEEALVATAFFKRIGYEHQQRIVQLWMGQPGEKQDHHGLAQEFVKRIPAMPRGDLARLLVDLALIVEATTQAHSVETPDAMLAMASSLDIDPAPIKKQIIVEQREAEKPKKPLKSAKTIATKTAPTPSKAALARDESAQKPAAPAAVESAETKAKPGKTKNPAPAKPANEKAKPAVRYRHPDNGLTWSGKGIQPAWVAAWINSAPERSLNDLEIKTNPAPTESANKPATPAKPEEPFALTAWPFPNGARKTKSGSKDQVPA